MFWLLRAALGCSHWQILAAAGNSRSDSPWQLQANLGFLAMLNNSLQIAAAPGNCWHLLATCGSSKQRFAIIINLEVLGFFGETNSCFIRFAWALVWLLHIVLMWVDAMYLALLYVALVCFCLLCRAAPACLVASLPGCFVAWLLVLVLPRCACLLGCLVA